MRTRVKICGITRPEDGLEAARSGADAIGLVFYPQSPRSVDVTQARLICQLLPPFVTVVGLFVDEEPDRIKLVLDSVPLDMIQFHGSEFFGECNVYGRPYIKAITMQPDIDVAGALEQYPDATGFLLDAYHPDLPGGSGQVFDWDKIPADVSKPIILAGGLDPDNVAEAVRRVSPYAVDVSSGVEVSEGIKDPAKIAAFIRGVRSVDSES
ncbi:MAG: phosphoribosylanthranilate isomerase [Gammaproteobacteria bacterium]